MSIELWRIGVDTPAYTAEDMSGIGAKHSGGRWNEPGIAALYVAENRALACLETLAHLGSAGLPLNRYLVRIKVPDKIWQAAQCFDAAVPAHIGWDALPSGRVSIGAGTAWLKAGASALLLVPSAIVPEECNVLINPAHPDARHITASKVRKWTYDARLRRA
jgi:RES domain-containing protein